MKIITLILRVLAGKVAFSKESDFAIVLYSSLICKIYSIFLVFYLKLKTLTENNTKNIFLKYSNMRFI